LHSLERVNIIIYTKSDQLILIISGYCWACFILLLSIVCGISFSSFKVCLFVFSFAFREEKFSKAIAESCRAASMLDHIFPINQQTAGVYIYLFINVDLDLLFDESIHVKDLPSHLLTQQENFAIERRRQRRRPCQSQP
jgi:hypothetical protein